MSEGQTYENMEPFYGEYLPLISMSFPPEAKACKWKGLLKSNSLVKMQVLHFRQKIHSGFKFVFNKVYIYFPKETRSYYLQEGGKIYFLSILKGLDDSGLPDFLYCRQIQEMSPSLSVMVNNSAPLLISLASN
ncbi:MAG: hypothetical protein IPN49_12715 [Saprospiraceae bacterium]|nr:hypothetical protein [Saprospiraceae bacterium]